MKHNQQPILLVEDNPMDVELTLRALDRGKLVNPIEVARDGEEALQWFERWQEGMPLPVVVLLDLKLPKINGLEVLQEIKKHPVFKNIPVVVLTTSSNDSDVRSAYELGVNSYILKPVEFDKFVEVAGQIEVYWNLLNIRPY